MTPEERKRAHEKMLQYKFDTNRYEIEPRPKQPAPSILKMTVNIAVTFLLGGAFMAVLALILRAIT